MTEGARRSMEEGSTKSPTRMQGKLSYTLPEGMRCRVPARAAASPRFICTHHHLPSCGRHTSRGIIHVTTDQDRSNATVRSFADASCSCRGPSLPPHKYRRDCTLTPAVTAPDLIEHGSVAHRLFGEGERTWDGVRVRLPLRGGSICAQLLMRDSAKALAERWGSSGGGVTAAPSSPPPPAAVALIARRWCLRPRM